MLHLSWLKFCIHNKYSIFPDFVLHLGHISRIITCPPPPTPARDNPCLAQETNTAKCYSLIIMLTCSTFQY